MQSRSCGPLVSTMSPILDRHIHRFEGWAPSLGRYLFLPGLGGVQSLGPYSEMVGYLMTPDKGPMLWAHGFDLRHIAPHFLVHLLSPRSSQATQSRSCGPVAWDPGSESFQTHCTTIVRQLPNRASYFRSLKIKEGPILGAHGKSLGFGEVSWSFLSAP